MQPISSVIIFLFISFSTLIAFQNCAKKPLTTSSTSGASTISPGTPIDWTGYGSSNTNTNSSTGETTSLKITLEAYPTFLSANTVVPDQKFGIRVEYPRSLDVSNAKLMWDGSDNGKGFQSLQDYNSNGANPNPNLWTAILTSDEAVHSAGSYLRQLVLIDKTTGKELARSNTIPIVFSPLCKVSLNSQSIAGNSSINVSIQGSDSTIGLAYPVQKITGVVQQTTSGSDGVWASFGSSGSSGVISGSQLKPGVNYIRFVGMTSSGNVSCVSTLVSVNNDPSYSGGTPSGGGSNSGAGSGTSGGGSSSGGSSSGTGSGSSGGATSTPIIKQTLTISGRLCADFSIRTRVRHKADKTVALEIFGTDSNNNINGGCTNSYAIVKDGTNYQSKQIPGNLSSTGTAMNRITKISIAGESYKPTTVYTVAYSNSGPPNYYPISPSASPASFLTYSFDSFLLTQNGNGYCSILNTTGGFPIAIGAKTIMKNAKYFDVSLTVIIEGYNDSVPAGYALTDTLTNCMF